MPSISFVVYLFVCFGLVQSSHFRGGIIQWRPVNSTNFNGNIEITHRVAWRRRNAFCDANTIAARTLIGFGSLQCRSGCSGTLGSMNFYCTDFSATEDWSSGERTYTVNIGSASSFEASFASCCWIPISRGGGYWSVLVRGSLTPRSDNGLINSSPVTATTPIIRLQHGCTKVIVIPVQDADGDDIRCRWAQGSECAGVCQAFPYATLSGCSLHYNGGGSTGWYAVALQIEDFMTSSSNTALSSVPLQFLVNVFSSSLSCNGSKPVLVGETIADGACIAVPFGTTFRTSVVALVGHSTIRIIEFPTVSPLGIQKSPVVQSVYNSTLYYTNITWTPQTSQYGLNILCYSARDSNSLTSDQFCITLLGGVLGPEALQNSTFPTEAIIPGQPSYTFSVSFDQEIGRPTRVTYIRIYEDSSGNQVDVIDVTTNRVSFPVPGSGGQLLNFTTNYMFQSGRDYYILLDLGVAVGSAFCNQDSLRVHDNTFWNFTVGINECAVGLDNCSSNANCTDTPHSYSCQCFPGYGGDGFTCNDIDECALGTAVCPMYSLCNNVQGSYTCSCKFGGSGISCNAPPSPNPPLSLRAQDIGSTVATVSWASPVPQTHNPIAKFILTVTEQQFGRQAINVSLNSSLLTYTFSGLDEFNLYRCEIVSVSVYGLVSVVSSITFTTLQAAPSAPPLSLAGVAVSPSLITLSWADPPLSDINGNILFYFVVVTEVPTGRNLTFHAFSKHITIGPLHAYYEYSCRVSAYTVAFGPYSPSISVYSGEAVPTASPRNLVVDNTTTGSMSISWSPPRFDQQNGRIRYYVVYLTELIGPNATREINSTSTTLLITNLLPFYSYTISVAAFTIGIGPSTASITTRLPVAAPSAPPENINGYPLDHTSIYFTWSPPPLHKQHGIIVQYIVDVTENETSNMFQVNTTSTETSIILTSLHPDYTYHLSVTAVTISEGPFSSSYCIRTHPGVPSSAPRSLATVLPDPYSFILSWDPPRPEDKNGQIIIYIINGTEVQTGEMFQFSTNLTTLVIEDLQPYTTYVCVIAAGTIKGLGPFGSPYAVTTLEDIPSQPIGPSVSQVTGEPTSLFVSWREPTVFNGIITHYTVYCEESDISSYGSGDLSPMPMDISNGTTVGPNSTSVELSGLTPYTRYDCLVTASTSAGESNATSVVSATTDESEPGDTPQNLMNSGTTSSSVFLVWSQPSLPNGIIVSYTITYNLTGIATSVLVNSPLSTNYTITGLKAFTFYKFVIFASTRIGSGPSTTVVIQTQQASPDSPPLNTAASVSSSTSSSISWLPPLVNDQNGIIAYYTLLLKDLQFNTSDIMINTTSTTYYFTGLQEYARYSCRIAAATSAGLGPYSTPVVFVTDEDVPSAPPQQVTGVVQSSTLVTFSWSPPPSLDVNGVIQHYTVRVTERHTGRVWTFFAVDADISIGSLHPYYYYDCVVSAFTIGFGPFSLSIAIRTNQAAPIAPPDQLSGLVTSDALTLMWRPPSFEDANGVIQHIVASITELDTGKMFTRNASSSVVTFTNLHPYYRYECSVAAYTIALGPSSQSIIVQLDEEPPTAEPTNIVGTSLSSDSVHITWDPPPRDSQNGLIRSYVVNVTEVDTGDMWVHSVSVTEVTLFSLHPFYSYELSIAAVTIAPGPPSQSVIVQTDPDIPGTVQDTAVSFVTPDAVHLTWEAPNEEDQNGIIIGYHINVTALSTGNTFQITTSNNGISVTSLKPYTVYIFHIAAFTEVGDGPYSIAIQVTTDPTAPSSSPEDVLLLSISSTSIQISWSPPPAEDHNGIIRVYRINITEVDTGIDYMFTSTSTSIVVPMLHPFYTYECMISAVTVEEGPYTKIVSITTPEDVPSGYPQNTTNSSVTSRSAVISWEPPLEEDRNGIIVEYTVFIAGSGNGQTLQLNTLSTFISVTTLIPFTRYFITVAASTSVGLGPPSVMFTLDTHEDVPTSFPVSLGGVVQDSRTVLLSWHSPDSEGHYGIIREYRIRVAEISTGNVSLYTSPTTTIEISGLHPAYTYQWSVAAFTVGIGPYSIALNVTTAEDAPSSSPLDISLVTINSTSVRVTWSPPVPADRNGAIIGYVLRVTLLDTGSVSQLTAVDLEFDIAGLIPFTRYSVAIAARTAIGLGPFSQLYSVTTNESAPGSHPTNSAGTTINSTHISLTWEPPPENLTHGIIREYRISITEDRTGKVFTYVTDSATRQLTVGELHPFYIYHCTIVAYTVEPGPYTEVIIVQTDEAAPAAPPQNFTAISHDPHSISFSWEPPQPDMHNGILRQYFITLISVLGVETRTVSASSTSVTVIGLKPYTVYTCSVAAESVALGPQSDNINVTTPEDAPTGPPQTVRSLAVDARTLFIQWAPPAREHRNGVVRRYIINVTEFETGRQEQFYSVDSNITITSRHPAYQYRYSITAETVATGPFSFDNIICMPEAAPSMPPTNIAVVNTTSRSFHLSWDSPPSVSQNGIIRNYTILVFVEDTGDIMELSTQKTYELLENLHPYYNYTFKITAVTVAAGPFSQSQSVLTLEDIPVSPPRNFTVATGSSTSLLLKWEPLLEEDRNGLILGYTIKITDDTGALVLNQNTQNTGYLVERLLPFTAYTCLVTAFTAIGNGPDSFNVTVTTFEDEPGAPRMVKTTAVTSTAVTLNWSSPDVHNGIIRHYLVLVYETISGRNFTRQSQANTEITVGGLHPYYTYEFSVQAVTIASGPLSVVLTVLTSEDVPTGYPRGIEAFAMDSTTLMLEWDPPLLELQNGIIVDYIVNVSAVETTSVFEVAAGGALSVAIPGLHPFYTYNYIIAAATRIGRGPFSMANSVQLPQDVPSLPPNGLSGESINSTSIALNWQHPPSDGQNGIITTYIIILTDFQTNQTTMFNREGTHLDLVIVSLHPFYWYKCVVAAATLVGQGPFTPFITVQTKEDAPSGPPVSVNVTAINSKSVHMSWELPLLEHQNGIIKEFHISLVNTVTGETSSFSTSSLFIVINELHPHYTYVLSVAAVTVSVGPYNSGTAVTLPQDTPTGIPQNVEIVSVSSSSIRISWNPPLAELQNGVITSYHITVIEIETNTILAFETHTADTLYIVNSLHPFYNYNCSIAAFTVGLGPSTYATVRTLPEESSEVPQDIVVSASSPSVAVMQWKPPPAEHQNGIIVGYVVHVSGLDTDEEFDFSVNGSQLSVTELHPYYSYRFSVAAVTIAVGPFSNPISLQMPEAAPSASVENMTSLLVTATSTRLAWYPPHPDEWNGVVVGYTVEYQLVETVEGDVDSLLNPIFTLAIPSFGQPLMNSDDPTMVRLPLNMEMAFINNLDEYSVYQFWVYYETSAGRSSNSDSIMIRTFEEAPTGPPVSVSAMAASSSSLTIMWRPPVPTDRNGMIIGYNVLLLSRETMNQKYYNVSGATLILSVEGLDSFTEFEVAVAGKTSVGAGPFSQPVAVKTKESFPGAPSNVVVKVDNSTTVSVLWLTPSKPNGEILQFQVVYFGYKINKARVKRSAEVDIIDGPHSYDIDKQETSTVITGLQPGLFYNFTVRAKTGGENGGFGENSTAVQVELLSVAIVGASTGGSESSEAVAIAVLGWILLVVIVVIILAIYIYRRKAKFKKFVPGASFFARGRESSGRTDDRIYEIPGAYSVNPLAIETESCEVAETELTSSIEKPTEKPEVELRFSEGDSDIDFL